jgi:hypothetical protein
MKESHRCPKCAHNRVLQIGTVPDADADPAVPIRAAAVAYTGFGTTAGELEAFVCQRCGYTEFFTKDPAVIPVDGRLVREHVGSKQVGPYR